MQLEPIPEFVIITIVTETMAFIQITSIQSILVTADQMVVVSEEEILVVAVVVIVVAAVAMQVVAAFKNCYCTLLGFRE